MPESAARGTIWQGEKGEKGETTLASIDHAHHSADLIGKTPRRGAELSFGST